MSATKLFGISIGFAIITTVLVMLGFAVLYTSSDSSKVAGDAHNIIAALRGIALLAVAMITGLFSTCFALMAFMRGFMDEFQMADEA